MTRNQKVAAGSAVALVLFGLLRGRRSVAGGGNLELTIGGEGITGNPWGNFIPAGAPSSVRRWEAPVLAAAQRTGTHPRLIMAVIWQESTGFEGARGAAGEVGLMQIMDGAAQDLGFSSAEDLWNPELNIRAGAAYLGRVIDQMNRPGETVFDGVRAYNAGVTGARRSTRNGKAYAEAVFKKAGW